MCLTISFRLKRIIFVEIIVRIVLYFLALLCSNIKPFVRHIQPEEMWKYNYPQTNSYVSTTNLLLLISFVTLFLFICECFNNKKQTELTQLFLSYTLILGLNGFITTLLKVVVGRLRPDFLSRCFGDEKPDNVLDCSGEENLVLNGRKSFPSGHSSFAFASMVFVSLYLARKLKLFCIESQKEGWRLCVCVIPLLIATLIAISRTCDYHHHWEDVLVGSLLGSTIAYTSFKYYFPQLNNLHKDGNEANRLLLDV